MTTTATITQPTYYQQQQQHGNNNNTNTHTKNNVLPSLTNGLGYATNIYTSSKNTYTWQQVAMHNTEQSAWISFEKKVYDITDWMNRHPGGKHILLITAGRDLTDMIPSYHPFSNKPQEVLEKYYIGDLLTTEFPSYKPDSGFYKECRAELAKYFKTTQKNPKNPFPGLYYLFFFLTTAFVSYYVMATSTFPTIVRILAAITFGVFQAMPLLHCMHDSSHLSIGNSQKSWIFIGYFTMDYFAGASINSWYNQHTLGHHVYTNLHDVDPDVPFLASTDIRRVSKHQRQQWFYAYQTYYLCILYGVLAIKFRIQDITNTMIMKSNGVIRVNKLYENESLHQLFTKCFWFTWRFIIPLYFFNVDKQSFLLLNLLAEFITGYYLTFNFQVSHVNPSCTFLAADQSAPEIQDEWAVSQLETTLDYAHDSPLATFLCGALNYQSIHHLFPCISQYHYPAIAPIVARIAKKYKVRYNYVPSFWQAIKLHLQQLTEMGAEHVHHY